MSKIRPRSFMPHLVRSSPGTHSCRDLTMPTEESLWCPTVAVAHLFCTELLLFVVHTNTAQFMHFALLSGSFYKYILTNTQQSFWMASFIILAVRTVWYLLSFCCLAKLLWLVMFLVKYSDAVWESWKIHLESSVCALVLMLKG